MRPQGLALLFYVCFLSTTCDTFESEDEDVWLDPNEPERSPLVIQAMQDSFEKSCPKPEFSKDPSLRLILNQLFYQLQVKPSSKTGFSRIARLSLSAHDVSVISAYLDNVLEEKDDELAERESVRNALHNMVELLDSEPSYLNDIWLRFRSICFSANALLFPVFLFFTLRAFLKARSFWFTLISILFVCSMVSTYNRMYQEKMAARLAHQMEVMSSGEACAPATLAEQALGYFSSLIHFKSKSKCLKYIESQTVSIVSEISVIDVMADVVSNGFLRMAANSGSHLNRFYRELFTDIPLASQFLITFTFLLVVMILFVRIRLPFFVWEPMFASLIYETIGIAIREGRRDNSQGIEMRAMPNTPQTLRVDDGRPRKENRRGRERMIEGRAEEFDSPLRRRDLSRPRQFPIELSPNITPRSSINRNREDRKMRAERGRRSFSEGRIPRQPTSYTNSPVSGTDSMSRSSSQSSFLVINS